MVERLALNREGDWQSGLVKYIADARDADEPFVWGTNDCCTFAAGAVKAMTGVDPIPEFRGKYTTEFGSAKALKKYGAGDLAQTLDAKFETVDLAHVRRGDLVFYEGNLGVVTGRNAWFVSDTGLESLPVKECDKAWRAG